MKSTASAANLTEMLQLVLGEPIQPDDIDDSICFLTAIVLLMIGTIHVDGEVEEEEKQHFYTVLRQFFPKERFGELTQKIVRGISANKLFRQATAFQLCTDSFSTPERLLLMSFGYQISTSDGSMHVKEQQYLQKIGQLLKLETRYLNILERGFSGLPIDDRTSLQEVRNWLDPVRFQTFDTVFVEAASFMEEHLPNIEIDIEIEIEAIKASINKLKSRDEISSIVTTSDASLVAFQHQRHQLVQLNQQLADMMAGLHERALLPKQLLDEATDFVERLQSSTFRVAVIGEFSKGKSTLLNALLGQDIQPVSMRPCSSTISILRYGETSRLICCYTDGTEAEISLDEYVAKSTIPKEETEASHVGNYLVQTLLNNPIDRLIYESPELEFCKNGIEIVDSPGLNEHPNRTAVTQAILEETDAVIVLLSAMQLLTESERELVQEIAPKVIAGHGEQTVSGLFAVVNFVDCLDEDEPEAFDDLKSRTENFFLGGDTPFVPDRDRLHYISAKQALKAKKAKVTNAYLSDFNQFIRSLEQFLTRDRGSLQFAAALETTDRFLNVVSAILTHHLEQEVRGQQEQDQERQHAIDLMGNASGRALKAREEAGELVSELDEKLIESFNQWWEERLFPELQTKRRKWSCEKSSVFDRDQVVAYASRQFECDFTDALQGWLKSEAVPNIIAPALNGIEQIINHHITALQSELKTLDQGFYSSTFDWTLNDLKFTSVDGEEGNLMGGLSGVALAAAAIALPGILLPLIIGSLVGGFGLGTLMGLKDSLFDSVFGKCCDVLGESCQKIYDGLLDEIIKCAKNQLDEFDTSIEKVLGVGHMQLEQLQIKATASDQERAQSQQFTNEQLQKLNTMRQEMAAIAR
ncbi:MAG: hypothetical protein EAZ61_12040 [Oscillatoriales cyanobacterium]|nr:MAG: hypothetical protein EAZ61_12040 [Oscillatoriales cyanobacterium]